MTLDEIDSPAFVGRRQQHFDCRASALLDFDPCTENEAGLTVLISNEYHSEIAVSQRDGRRIAVARRRAGSLVGETVGEPLPHGPVTLFIKATRQWYELGYLSGGTPVTLATTEVRFLSGEVAGGYTGAYFGMYATARHCESANHADFDWFDYEPLG